ncbi:MAG: galactose mutarotase [Lachnospiraceae bacterium]|nr:galactose mutarotase [Lachnospiraceae bacterium]
MNVSKASFGKTKDGQEAFLYTMENDKGMKVTVSDFGAVIVNIIVPDRNGNFEDVALGYDSVTGYEDNGPGYGSFIGRHANRIGGAQFTINGKTYELAKNDNGVNNLHSGPKSYNKYFYEVETYSDEESVSVEFSRLSPDGEQGFPGNLDVTVTYTLTNDNDLAIEYFADCDQDTVINLTNHTYFNLAGQDSGSVLDQEVWINSHQITPTDKLLIPTGEVMDITGTAMDFREPKPIGRDINADMECLKIAGGYDHNYVLDLDIEEEDEMDLVAILYDPQSGRKMEVYTDLPGMQLYSGNFIDGSKDPNPGKGGVIYKKRDGVCFETQFYPNACNIPSFPTSIFHAGEPYDFCTVYSFTVEE